MWNSLRGRFIVMAAVLFAAFVVLTTYAQSLVNDTRAGSDTLIGQYYGAHGYLEGIKDGLRRVEAGLFAFTVTADPSEAQGVREELERIGKLRRQILADDLLSAAALTDLTKALGHILPKLERGTLDFLSRPDSDATAMLGVVRGELVPQLRGGYRLVHVVERRIYDAVLGETLKSLGTSDVVSSLGYASALIVILVLIGAYVTFELSIRRPLLGLAEALETEGRGEAVAPVLPQRLTRELAMIATAFQDMRQQIRSRQARLESVLNNTSDGIVTFDEQCRIQAFNAAAAALFGQDEHAMLGRSFSALLAPECDESVIGPEGGLDPAAVGSETVCIGRRADGTLFDLSCKISAFEIAGHRLFNAMVSDVSERKAMFDRLSYLAERDPLTSLYNRRRFVEELDRVAERCRRGHGSVAAMVIDLDHFKLVNDTMGHQEGDRLLMEVASKLDRRSREGDIVARLGGDEFAVLLFDVDRTAAERVAQSYCEQIGNHAFKALGRAVEIGCSIGIAMLTPEASEDHDVLVRADLACRVAKQMGRNRCHFYRTEDEQSTARLSAQIGYASLIRRALAEDRLALAFQPIVDVATGLVESHEVLVRLRNANGTIMPAQAFVTEAERLGLAPEIDAWVIRRLGAAMVAGEVPVAGGRYAVNVSGRSIGEEKVVAAIHSLLQDTRIDPGQITFELTETAAVSSLRAAQEFIGQLRSAGCKVALDDFGAGYSSFVYLRELDTDYVKLDGSLVRDIAVDRLNFAVVKAMNDVARMLGRKTVAEFVENAAVAEKLCQIGVDCGQGYFYGRPALWEDRGAAAAKEALERGPAAECDAVAC